ncbi:DUF6176 family protein [Isobaculum melis]|uniref:Uncharacterized protein n=1 Tax=Isobaculum melis TaxID=142588 RepID=A0A1H9S3X4_9LACT|nr:DUF6176 family protein [Isobaculum melis]SER78839.1 hypothetical protein SAMN04488559_10639 [Isobaculum melis]
MEPLAVECGRFRVKKGMSDKVDEWMQFLNDHMADVLLTLADEKMYVETIFREVKDGEEYLYWYSIQGPNGQAVETSNHEVDQIHLQFWEACIDPTFKEELLAPQVVMIPHPIRSQMK